jgi:ankyrin repeat protein
MSKPHLDYIIYLGNKNIFNDYIIWWASSKGYIDIVKRLISSNIKNELNISWPSANGHLDIVKYLVIYGANVRANNDIALFYASKNGHLNIVKFLTALGAYNKKAIEVSTNKDVTDYLELYHEAISVGHGCSFPFIST